MKHSKLYILLIFTLVSHLLYWYYAVNEIIVGLITFIFSFFIFLVLFREQFRKLSNLLLLTLFIVLSIQHSHVILRKVNYPFSYVGMYSFVDVHKTTSKEISRNLYNSTGQIISANSGFIISEMDDLESKLVTRLLKKNDTLLDSAILKYYEKYNIK